MLFQTMQLCRSIREHNDTLKANVRQKLQTLQTFNERRRMFRRSNSAQNGLLNTDNSKSLGKFCESHLILLTWLRSQQKDGSQNHEGKRTLQKPHSTAARLISQMTVTGSWPRARGKMQYNNKKGNTLKFEFFSGLSSSQKRCLHLVRCQSLLKWRSIAKGKSDIL